MVLFQLTKEQLDQPIKLHLKNHLANNIRVYKLFQEQEDLH